MTQPGFGPERRPPRTESPETDHVSEELISAAETVPAADPDIPMREQMRSSVNIQDARLMNALLTSPDPGPMGEMYVKLREIRNEDGNLIFPDGMTLAYADPLRPYTDIVQSYEVESQESGFSDLEFFYKNFKPVRLNELKDAEFGQTIDDFIEMVRPLLIKETGNVNGMDVELPADAVMAALARFLQAYHWDSGYAGEGLASDGLHDVLRNIIINTEHEINEFGHPINGSAKFYATRPQPPHLALMLRRLEDQIGPEALTGSHLEALEIEHNYWMDGMEELEALPDDGEAHAHRALVRLPDGTFVNRYWDDAEGPRLESYLEDVETANKVLETMPHLNVEEREIKRQEIYKHIRAAAASGWDFSARWCESGGDLSTICTTDIIPMDLNSLLVIHENALADGYEAEAENVTGDQRVEYLHRAKIYREMAVARSEAINEQCWDPEDEIYRDYNFAKDKQTEVVTSAMTYTLLAGVPSQAQAHGVMEALRDGAPSDGVPLLREGGLIATTVMDSPQQWDGINVWAPPNWTAIAGFAAAGHEYDDEELQEFAHMIKLNFMYGIEVAFEQTDSIPEKIHGDNPRVPAGGGEYALVKFLTMMAEAYRAADNFDPTDSDSHMARRIARESLRRMQQNPETN